MKIKKRMRLFFRAGLWIAGLATLLFIAAILIVRVQYPESRILSMISDAVENSSGMPLRIENVTWQLPLRLKLDQICLGYPGSDPEIDSTLVRIHRFSVSFRLLPLFKRRLHIQAVTLEQPVLYLDPERLKSIGTAPPDNKMSRDKPLSEPPPLPFAFGLSNLQLIDFNCTVILPEKDKTRQVRLTGLNLDLNNIHVPREITASLEDVRGQLRLFTESATLSYSDVDFQLSPVPYIDLTASWKKNEFWEAAGEISLANPDHLTEKIQLLMDVKGTGKADSISVRSLKVHFGETEMLLIQGAGSHLLTRPEYRMTFQSAPLNIQQMIRFITDFLPPALKVDLSPVHIEGVWNCLDGEITGIHDVTEFRLASSLSSGQISDPTMTFDSLFYNLNIQGKLFGTGTHLPGSGPPIEGRVSGSVGFNGLAYQLNDSTVFDAGPFELNLQARTDSTGLPVEGRITGSLARLFHGNAFMQFDWGLKPGAPNRLESLFVRGKMTAEAMQLEQIPGLSPFARGSFNVSAGLVMPNLYQGLADIRVNIPQLIYDYNQSEESLLPVDLASHWAFQIEPKFQSVRLDSGIVQINNLLTGRFHGQADIGKNVFAVEMDSAVIGHDQVFGYLPIMLQQNLEGISLDGKTELSGRIRGEINHPEAMHVQGHISVIDGAFHSENPAIHARGFKGDIQADGTIDRLTGTGKVSLESLDLNRQRDEPIRSSALNFSWEYTARDRVSLNTFILKSPDVGISLSLEGGMAIGETPRMDLGGSLLFEGEDWIEVIAGSSLRGQSQLQFQLTRTALDSPVAISGDLKIRNLDFRQDELLSMTNIHGRVPFQVDFDLNESMIVPDLNYTPPSWIDYESRRSQFRSLNPDQGALYLDSVEVKGYYLSDLAMDVDIRKGFVLIPWFKVNALNGNLGGYVLLFLGSGQPEGMAYDIHAQAARINAAALGNIAVKKQEEAELNATMAFTGMGIDFKKEIDLDGYFYITKIGPQFASFMLRGLDPNGEDRNIKLTRRLLDMGWKPKLFSFEMRHGYVYPSLSLTQPWISPIRLPEILTFGRLPLKFFLENTELARH